MAGWLLGLISQLCARPDLTRFWNDRSAKMLRPGERLRTFCDCLIVWAQPSTHCSAEPPQPFQILFDSGQSMAGATQTSRSRGETVPDNHIPIAWRVERILDDGEVE